MQFALIFGLLLYFLSQGVIEGWIWADAKRKNDNKLICADVNKGVGVFDYHLWRGLEMTGIAISTFSALPLGYEAIPIVIGTWGIGVFTYERMLCYVQYDHIFVENRGKFEFMGLKIKRSWYYDAAMLLGGISFLVVGLK